MVPTIRVVNSVEFFGVDARGIFREDALRAFALGMTPTISMVS
jgi:hypothetical protein